MDEIGMFTALRPQPEQVDVSGARDRLASAITGAPGRPRVSRRTRFTAAGGLAAAAAAAVTAVTLAAGSAPPALASVTTALTRTMAQSYHLTWQENVHHTVKGQVRKSPIFGTCTSAADPVRHLEATSCPSQFVRVHLEVGGYSYFYLTDPVDHSGKHWVRMQMPTRPLAPPVPLMTAVTLVAPQQILSEIKKAEKVTVAGPASGPGWTGTRYAFLGSPAPMYTISGTVAVDQQGRARVLALTDRSASSTDVLVVTMVLTFSDFGAPVTVTPPPADQIFTPVP